MIERNDRDGRGRFVKGHRAAGPGRPIASRMAKLREALVHAVTEDDIREIAKALIAQARAGDVSAAKEVFDRVLGKPVESDLLERIEEIEHELRERAAYDPVAALDAWNRG